MPKSLLPNVTSDGVTQFVEPFVGPPWNVHGPSWSAMVGHGRSWSLMVGHGWGWDSHARSWSLMVGTPPTDPHFFMVAHGRSWSLLVPAWDPQPRGTLVALMCQAQGVWP